MTELPYYEENEWCYFEVTILESGSNAIVGIGFVPEAFDVTSNLPGWTKHSIGYHGDDGIVYRESCPGRLWAETYGVGDVIGAGINWKDEYFYFTKNGVFLGSASSAHLGRILYPAVGFGGSGKVRINFGAKNTPFQFNFHARKWHEHPALTQQPR